MENRTRNKQKPVILIILDGWGLAPPGPGNAVFQAKTPNMDKFWASYPRAQLKTSGPAVGLPEGEMGSSESGHLTIGSGRIIYQDYSRISLSISSGSFFKNKAFLAACQKAKGNSSQLHLIGLLSSGSIHADKDHLYGLLYLAKGQNLKPEQVKLHIFTDGRDSHQKSAGSLLTELKRVLKQVGLGQIASLSGRYFAMDRDRHWERTLEAYNTLVSGTGNKANSAEEAINNYYQEDITDEFIPPTTLSNDKINDGDAIIFFNFRTDRARQLTRAFVEPNFYGFQRKKTLQNIFFVTMTEFEKGLPVSAVAFPPRKVDNALPRVISEENLRQLHIAETEKYAFVTYYFNGLIEKEVIAEDRILIPSPRVSTYDLKPEMSAYEITQKLEEKIEQRLYDFILVNYANPDMVGHTGILKAGIKACEVTDECVGKVVQIAFANDGICLITADHGNVEEMIDPKTGEVSTKHSLNPVPFIVVGKTWQGKQTTKPAGGLADIAPTVLKILEIPKPEVMMGDALIT